MTEYKTILTISEIDEFINSIPESQLLFLPTNKIISVKRKDLNIIWKGLFYISYAKITKIDNPTTVELKTRYKLPFYFVLTILLVFMFMFLFGNKVIINGNNNPSILERLGFVLIGLTMFSIPVGIFIKLRVDFVKRVVKELKLQKTTSEN